MKTLQIVKLASKSMFGKRSGAIVPATRQFSTVKRDFSQLSKMERNTDLDYFDLGKANVTSGHLETAQVQNLTLKLRDMEEIEYQQCKDKMMEVIEQDPLTDAFYVFNEKNVSHRIAFWK